jgi:hypothetical protein
MYGINTLHCKLKAARGGPYRIKRLGVCMHEWPGVCMHERLRSAPLAHAGTATLHRQRNG